MDLRFALLREADGLFSVHPQVDGAEQESFAFDFEIRAVAGALQRIEEGISSRDDLNEIGSRLWHAICPRAIRELITRAVANEEPVTLRLDLPVEGQLDGLPWEALFDISMNQPLGCAKSFVLMRTPPCDAPLKAWKRTRTGAVRVLVVVPEASNLRVDYEVTNLERLARSLTDDRITMEVLSGRVTIDVLDRKLAQESWDILHFIGHGNSDADGEVSIRLNGDERDSERWLDALTFAQLVANRHLQLAFLNCCLGAAPAKSRTLSGLGPHLARTARVPAIVAMRYEILDSDSIRFAETFYRELLSGEAPGRVDKAVQSGRWALLINPGELTRGFATPVVYLEQGREQLFDVAEVIGRVVLNRHLVDLPRKLLNKFNEGLCIPFIGPGLHAADLQRHPGAPACAPSLFQVVKTMADESDYPERAEVTFAETAGDGFVIGIMARVFQHYQRVNGRPDLIKKLRKVCQRDTVPEAIARIAAWTAPGYIYSHFDGLLEEALERSGKRPRSVNTFGKDVAAKANPLLLNLRGTFREAVVLTERDHESRMEELAKADPDVVDLLAGEQDRAVLFIGVSPRDPIVRRICSKHLERTEGTMQGPRFFVIPQPSPPDEAYWQTFDIHWITADPLDVVETLSAAGERNR